MVARSDIVHRLDASADRFPLRTLLGIVLACTSAGAALSYTVTRATLPAASSSAREPAANRSHALLEARDAADASVEAAAPRPTPEPAAVPPAAPSPSTAPAAVAPPKTPAPAEPPTRRHFERGAVAYLRCDGAQRAGSRFPCPRDRELETAVWRALAALSTCPAGDPGRGHGEARLTWSRGEALVVEWRKQEAVAGLDLGAVSKCVGNGLSSVRSSLPAQHAIAAFRFELR